MSKKRIEDKKSFVEKYQEKQELRKKLVKSGTYLYAMIGLPLAFVLAFLATMNQFGPGTLCYSDQAYTDISTNMEKCAIENHGFDRDTFRTQVDRYVETFDNGKTFLEGTLKYGYFEATVTMEMDENYHVVSDSGIKNYASVDDYARKFVSDLGIHVLGYALVGWFLLGKLGHYALSGFVWILRKISEENKNAKPSEPEKTEISEETSPEKAPESSEDSTGEDSKEETANLSVVPAVPVA